MGLERAGMRTIAFCDNEPFCRDWLDQQWPGVPCFDDVRSLHAGLIRERVDVLAGGFPCQDVSVAGKGAGIDGERSGLWAEMFRLVRELRPRWVLVENVPALRTRGADRVLGELESEGYTCWPFVVGADDVGAPHRRKRVWIVAHRTRDVDGDGREELRRARERTLAGGVGRRGVLGVGEDREEDRHVAHSGGDPVRVEQQRMSRRRSRGVRDEGQAVTGDDGTTVAIGLADSDGRRREGERVAQPPGVEGAPGRDADGRDGARMGHASSGGLGVGWSSPSPRDRGDAHGADASVAVAAGARREEPGREHARPLAAVAPPSWPARPGEPQHAWEPPRVVPRAQPGLGRDANGLPSRVVSAHRRARLKALGNSVVPTVVEAIGRAMITTDEALFSI